MNAHEVAEVNERRRVLRAEDHDVPYAPSPFAMVAIGEAAATDRFRREWLAASRSGYLTVLGPPMKVLMPVDRNPFPRFRPFRWLP